MKMKLILLSDDTYDGSTGRRSRITRKDGAGLVQEWTAYRYDEKKRSEVAVGYGADGQKTGDSETFQYDAGGRLTQYSEAIQSVKYTYDARGNLVRSVDTGGEGSDTRYFFDCWR